MSQLCGRSARAASLVTWASSCCTTGEPGFHQPHPPVHQLLLHTACEISHRLSVACHGIGFCLLSGGWVFACLVPCANVTCSQTILPSTCLPELSVFCRPRLMATAGCWFLWDFSFYGNKVFQSTFIKILSPAGAGQSAFLQHHLFASLPPLCMACFTSYMQSVYVSYVGLPGYHPCI